MKVTNTNGLPYSLKLKSGKYEAIDAGETKDMDIVPAMVEYYKTKGFDFEGGSRRAKKTEDDGAPKSSEPKVQTIEQATAPKE